MNQAELEQEMVDGGYERARKMFERNVESGNASANPYANAVYRRFVLPLAEVIKEAMVSKGPGRMHAHVALLKGLDPEAVAFIAVRSILNACLATPRNGTGRQIVTAVGRAVYSEYCLSVFDDLQPDLYHTLVHDFERKQTKSERHRMTVFLRKAKDAGIEFNVWGEGNQAQVAGFLIECLESLGFCTTDSYSVKQGATIKHRIEVALATDVQKMLASIQAHVMVSTPEVMPCVEKPVDWTAIDSGGWHTDAMRRVQPYCIRCDSTQREHFRNADLTNEFRALNKLQSVRWKINERMLGTIRRVAEHFDMDEIVSQADFPAPAKPAWLELGVEKPNMTPAQLDEFTCWKREKAEWHTQMKLRGTKWGRFYTATRIAEKFKHEPELYFVYFSDFRGRKYVQTTGVSPQGSDMQKALLMFAEGKPIPEKDQQDWFIINGANRFGVDKVTMEERIQWVADHHEEIMGFARDPIVNNAWREADCPFQFLAWCFEYSDWKLFGDAFRSHIPVGQDGSCNGLQNFSAMLRDEVGGKATNLIPNEKPSDIYAMVAEVCQRKLMAAPDDEAGFRRKWLSHGMNRTLVKRSVMTLPYGSTRFSCSDFIVGDYLRLGKAVEFAKSEYGPAATYLSHFVWSAIGEVVVKAREAMDWLQLSARKLVRDGVDQISWVTPSGFPAIQTYWEADFYRITTRLCGGTKLRIHREVDSADLNRHRNGIAPNFIHSMDASHLSLVVLASESMGIDALAMIHDDYGTHAADSPKLAKAIRDVFVQMYTDYSPLDQLVESYPTLTKPPKRGSLDLEQVRSSRYFFC